MGLITELRRRNVFRMAVLYLVAAWLIMQVADVVIGLAELPSWTGRFVLILLAIGFPIALVFSWFYELTPEGIALDKDVPQGGSIAQGSSRRVDFIVIALLTAAVLMFAYDKWWGVHPPEESIAVLPFVNLSDDPDQQYFSDALSEELLNLLAQLPEIKVTARTSSFQFRDSPLGIQEIGAKLDVAHVLEGSVRRSGDRVRITAQLIRSDDGYQVWSDSFEREIDDIFALQQQIAGAITGALEIRLKLSGGGSDELIVATTESTEAYDAYLRARELIRLRTMDNLVEAVGLLENALDLDEGFAPAHAQLAIALLIQRVSQEFDGSYDDNLLRALEHAERALALVPELPEAHAARALLSLGSNNPEQVIVHARKALERHSSYDDAMMWLNLALRQLGRYSEADAVLEQLVDIDPLSMVGRFSYANYLADTGKFDEAHEIADQIIADNAEFGYWAHNLVALAEGDIARVLDWALHIPSPNPVLADLLLAIGEYDELRRIEDAPVQLIDLAEGRYEEAIEAARAILASDSAEHMSQSYAEVTLYYTGQVDEIREMLEGKLRYAIPGRPILGEAGPFWTMRLAAVRRLAGEEEGAQELVQLVRRDIAARRASGRDTFDVRALEAQVAAFDRDADQAIAKLATTLQPGLMTKWAFDDPLFAELQDDPRFVALRAQYETNVAAAHDEVLQIICFDNPAPDIWQPLPETCEGLDR